MFNIEAIIITNSIGIALVILTLVSSTETRRSKTLETRLLTWMLIVIACSCMMEALAYLVDGKTWKGARELSMGINTWLYLANPGFSTMWCLYVDYRMYQSQNRMKLFRPLLLLTAVLYFIILCNAFGGYLFTISDDNIYRRMPLSYVFFAMPVVYVTVSVADVYRYKKKHGGLSFFPIQIFLTLFFLGVLIQALFYGVSIAWCSLALAVAGVYMSLQNQLLYKDPLTGLFNRYYLNYMFKSQAWGQSGIHSGIMIDVDEFKIINDLHGHAAGDQALCDAAGVIAESVPDNSTVIRFAGDEFIVLLRTGSPEEADAVAQNIARSIQLFNSQNDRPYQLSLSMGTTVYQAGTTTQDQFLEEMDHRMYENKQKKYANGSLTERRRR